MDYEKSIKMADPGQAIKEKFYEQFIKPHLTKEPDSETYGYFLHAGYQAWRFSVDKDDIKNMLFVEYLCEELRKKDETEFFEIVSKMFSEHENARVRKKESERNYYESADKNAETKLTNAVRHYKVFFESEFRLWGTIPYYYASKVIGVKSKGSGAESFVNIASSEKLFAINGVKIALPRGDLKNLTKGFNNEIRNAGEGHDSYEITDEDKILLKVIDPKTGEQKGSKTIELTYGQLDNLIQECRKSIWVIETGVMIFVNNNPDVRKAISQSKPLKMREIQKYLFSFAYNRWFDLDNFNYDKNSNKISLELKYVNRKIGKSGELLFSTGEKFDLIDVATTVKYKEQILGMVQHLVRMILPNPMPNLSVKITDDRGNISGLEFEPNELIKLMLKKSEMNIPKLKNGEYPKGEYKMINTVRVPYGSKAFMIAGLKAKGFDVVE